MDGCISKVKHGIVFKYSSNTLYRIRQYFLKIEIVILPDESELSGPTVTLCNQFKVQYLAQCKTDIVTDKR